MISLNHFSPILRHVCCAALLAAGTHAALADTLNVTVNSGTTTTSTAPTYVNDFSTASIGTPSTFTAAFGTSGVSGTYTGGFAITDQQPVGGAAGGKYITGGGNAPSPGSPLNYTLTLSSNVSYFGFYLAAFDSGNQLALFNGDTQVGTVSNATLASLFSACPSCTYSKYPNQPFGFVNITDLTGSFNKIEFIASSTQNFESDNHTITAVVPVAVAATPEPSSLVLLGSGALSLAGVIRRRFVKA